MAALVELALMAQQAAQAVVVRGIQLTNLAAQELLDRVTLVDLVTVLTVFTATAAVAVVQAVLEYNHQVNTVVELVALDCLTQ